MISSGRVIHAPLERASCKVCGYGFLVNALPSSELTDLYSGDYTVRRADTSTEVSRARIVKDLVSEIWGVRPAPASILEVGCGAGALLTQLRGLWPEAESHGVEPAPRLAALAQEAGHFVHTTRLEEIKFSTRFDVICSVNVMEHFPTAEEVFSKIASLLAPEGLYIQITPDGELPGLELLFRDHVSSFSSSSLARFAAEASLEMTKSQPLNGAMQEFRLSVFAPGKPPEASAISHSALAAARERYLARIANPVRTKDWADFHVFGSGEMADLLNAYRPEVVERSLGFVVDRPMQEELHGKPIRALADIGRPANFVLAVHPRSMEAVRVRLTELGHNVALLEWKPERV